MFDFFKKLVDGSSSNEELMKSLLKTDSSLVARGSQIADDCVVNGLRSGAIVKMSDIERMIHTNESRPAPVMHGFMKRMAEYLDTNEIRNVNFENDEIVFVHKDHMSEFFKKLGTTK